jgi:hypothetical protein
MRSAPLRGLLEEGCSFFEINCERYEFTVIPSLRSSVTDDTDGFVFRHEGPSASLFTDKRNNGITEYSKRSQFPFAALKTRYSIRA